MKALFSNDENQKGFNSNHRKENHFQGEYSVFAINDKTGEIDKKISCRLYGTSAMNYCCIWISTNRGYMQSGSGSAGGYGYHRTSGAVDHAITAAGYFLQGENGKRQSINGVGESAIREALLSIAELEGYVKPQVFQSHP